MDKFHVKKTLIRIGGASGYWGDASIATPQLLSDGNLDYLVYDYLAEITMSIMARARAVDESKGYATDFVYSTLRSNLTEIAKQGVKVIANAGGVNPQACAAVIRELLQTLGLELKVAVVLGDDLLDKKEIFAKAGHTEMFSADVFPDPDTVASINAYLGAFPVAKALDDGADIVITGRCVDSAVTLGACIHEFGWQADEFNKLAQGSLAGHILECGTQATGGNFTDWEGVVETLADAGYPIAEISPNGDFIVTKPEGTGGVVNVGTVAEQMLYEIGDPQAYILPDVICDFSQVHISQLDKDAVLVSGALGHGAPESYKVSTTYADGYRSGNHVTFYGRDAERKAQKFAQIVLTRSSGVLADKGMNDFSEACVEVIGAETHYGVAKQIKQPREVDLKIAVKHEDAKGVEVFLKELVGLYLSGPPGLTGFAGARAKPSPVVRLFSFLIPKSQVDVRIEINGQICGFSDLFKSSSVSTAVEPVQNFAVSEDSTMMQVSLESLAWGRSGDKGNKVNIGIIARHPDFLPWVATTLSENFVENYFAHFINSTRTKPVERFYLPGINALNFLIHDVLGGGGMASLRSDPQGKGYAQLLLAEQVSVPKSLTNHKNFKLI